MYVSTTLSFCCSTMGAGKSDYLIKTYVKLSKKGVCVCVFNHAYDNRSGFSGFVTSRLGSRLKAIKLHDSFDIFCFIKHQVKFRLNLYYLLIDEAQFLKIRHIRQMVALISLFDINVMCFGLRSDFLGEPFPTSSFLLAVADYLIILPAFCFCGKVAVFNMRINSKGKKVVKGAVIMIGGEGLYTQVCRRHYLTAKIA